MRGTLVLSILAVQSSYLRRVEQQLQDGAGVPDTLQWWVGPAGTWRIRTFALDHDIHTHAIRGVGDMVELARTSTRRHYGDVIRSEHVIELIDCMDATATSAAFRAAGLEPRIEIAEGRLAYWKPDDARYYTQSDPE